MLNNRSIRIYTTKFSANGVKHFLLQAQKWPSHWNGKTVVDAYLLDHLQQLHDLPRWCLNILDALKKDQAMKTVFFYVTTRMVTENHWKVVVLHFEILPPAQITGWSESVSVKEIKNYATADREELVLRIIPTSIIIINQCQPFFSSSPSS